MNKPNGDPSLSKLDIVKLEEIFIQHPKLISFIHAGTITLKAARTILDLDRWLMYGLFTNLLEIGAVYAAGAAAWKATPALIKYLKERANEDA
jgi:hypothetical protein